MKCKLCWLFIKFPFSYLLLLPQQKQRGSCLTQKGSTGLKLVQHILFYKQEWQLLTQIIFYINNRIIYPKWRRSELRMSCFVQPPTVAFTIIPHWDGFKHWKTSTVASSAVWDWARIFVKKNNNNYPQPKHPEPGPLWTNDLQNFLRSQLSTWNHKTHLHPYNLN